MEATQPDIARNRPILFPRIHRGDEREVAGTKHLQISRPSDEQKDAHP
jgi:hypothetical protein